MADRLADLVLRITADSKQLTAELGKVTGANARATKRVASDWKSVGSSLSGVAGILGRITSLGGLVGGLSFAGLASMAADAESAADSLDKLSQRFGISTTAIQEYRFAAGQAGVEQGELDSALQKAAKSIGEAQLGTGRARTSIAALGVELRDTSGQARSFESVFEDIIRALARVENSAQRSALAQRILGGSGAGIAALAGQFDELLARGRELGVAIDEDVVTALASAQDASEALSAVMDQRLSKSLQGVSGIVLGAKTRFVEFVETLTNAAEAIGVFDALQSFVPPESISDLTTLERRVASTTKELERLNSEAAKLSQPLGPRQSSSSTLERRLGIDDEISAAKRELEALARQRDTLVGAQTPITDPIKLDASALDTSAGKAAARAAAAEAKAAAREVEQAQQRLNTVIEASFTPAERLTAAMDQLGVDYREGKISADGFAEGQDAIVRQFDEIDEKIETSALKEIDSIIAAGLTPAEKLVEDLDRIGQLYAEGSISAEKFALAQESISKQLGEVDVDPMKKQLEDLEQVGTGVFEGLTGALADFVTTGKVDIASFAQSVASEFVQIAIKAGLSSLFGGIFSTATGSIPGLARGGPTVPGRPYIIGEDGPELFVPKSAGIVVPNQGGRPASAGVASLAAAPAPVFVTVNNTSRSQVDVQQRTGPSGTREIEVMIEDAVARNIARGGTAGRAVDRRLGVRPKGV